ncbi:hypothetical protein [Microbacterium sp. NPDC055665]
MFEPLVAERFPIEHRWEPPRVLKLQSLMVDYFLSKQGFAMTGAIAEPIPPLWRTPVAQQALDYAALWARFAPIWVDPAFADMAVGAAVLIPDDAPFHPEDLLSPSGCLVFAEPLQIEDLLPAWRFSEHRPGDPIIDHAVRAITWETKRGGFVHVMAWKEATPGTRELEPYLGFPRHVYVRFAPNDTVILRLLQSIAAVTRTDRTATDRASLPSGLERRAISRGIASPSVRRFYLLRPEEGQYERDAAANRRDARLHWVSGHWRNQPYPSEGITRAIFIAGHLRGSAELGVVSGTRLGIAQGTHYPQEDQSPTPLPAATS